MADAPAPQESPIKSIQVEALVVLKMAKHGSSTFPTAATGALVGMDKDAVLEVTNSFPFPVADVVATSDSNSQREQDASAAAAAAAPRQKAAATYQHEMIQHLKEVNVDANSVGWYTSAAMGNYINVNFVENLFHYQKDNEKAVALVYDVSKSSQGSLSLKAFRLTPVFVVAFREGKFTTENLQKTKLSYRDILEEVPVVVHNSHLITSFLHTLPAPPTEAQVEQPTSLADLARNPVPLPLYPSIDTLDLSIDPFLEKTCDLLLESIDAHYTDLNNFQFYQRQLGREQAKISQWQAKRKAENAARAAAKQAPLPEDEWQRLFKLPQEPSRLEGMLNAKQVDQYSRQADGFTANVSAKMFAVRENVLPNRG